MFTPSNSLDSSTNADKDASKSQECYVKLVNGLDDGFILAELIWDQGGQVADAVILEVNAAYEKQTGTKASDSVGKHIREVAPAIEQYWFNCASKAAKTGKTLHYEAYNQETDRYYDAQFIPLSTNQIGVLFRDITEHKKADEKLNKTQQELNTILDSSPTIIFYKDREGKFIQANRAFAQALKVTKEQLLGKTVFDIYSANIAQAMTKDDLTVFESKQPKIGIVEPYESPTGLRWIRTDKIPSFDENGKVTGLIGFSEDITERKNLETQLIEKERMAAIGATAGMVGHDLRNPLQSIIGEVYMARNELEKLPDSEHKASLQENIRAIAEQISYMNKIVSDLQTFVKPVEPIMQIVKLKPLIAALLSKTITPNNIQASIQIDDTLTVEADPQLLKRVLINLVTNAMQAMPEGGEIRIIAQADSAEQVQITVEDTGTGIPEEIKPKLFTPLFTTKSKGQGFGLAVCKRVIEAMRGTISFESQQGKGTKFIINFPFTIVNGKWVYLGKTS